MIYKMETQFYMIDIKIVIEVFLSRAERSTETVTL